MASTTTCSNSDATPSAIQRVFQTPELLESIFILLDLPTLLRMQLLSPHFHTTITTSSLLRQTLFLNPIYARHNERVWLVDIINLPAQQHPLRRDFKARLRVRGSVERGSLLARQHFGLQVTPARVNPLFLKTMEDPSLGPPVYVRGTEEVDLKADEGTPVALHSLSPFDLTGKFKRHTVQEMFLTQPPIPQVHLEVVMAKSGDAENSWDEDDDDDDVDGGGLFPMFSIPDHPFGPRPGARRGRVVHTATICEKGNVRLRHVSAAIERMQIGKKEKVEEMNVFLPGIVVVNDVDERVVAQRTRQWRADMGREMEVEDV